MEKFKIAFTTGHGESIHIDVRKNFLQMIAFFQKSGMPACNTLIDDSILGYNLLILGYPLEKFTEPELELLRKFVKAGGKLMILLKFGGDHRAKSNIGSIFTDITPKNDLLIDSNRSHKVTLDLSFSQEESSFMGQVVYDGGCTFDVKGEVDLVIYPKLRQTLNNPNSSYKGEFTNSSGAVLVYKKIGLGSVLYWGSRWTFSDEQFNSEGNSTFLRKISNLLIPTNAFQQNVEDRMSRVQRHRLLHGFPMPEASQKEPELLNSLKKIELDNSKKLAIGIIPHPMCNPKIHGCGYCPFPHEKPVLKRMEQSISTVINELKGLKNNYPEIINERQISSIYFGGGTANLTDCDLFDTLCKELSENLKIDSKTEITLEGTPYYFGRHQKQLNSMRKYFKDADLRISIGVQTFDKDLLTLCGRDKINGDGTVQKAVKIAKELDFRVSADFLINMPNQTEKDILEDFNKALELELEHLSFYSLVLDRNINVPWSKNEGILSALPTQSKAFDNFLYLLELLKENKYSPLTVTDYKLDGGEKGYYQYEDDLRKPESVDWLGLGSYAISLFANKEFSKAIKLMNPQSLGKYLAKGADVKNNGICYDTIFKFNQHDLRLFWITRQIKGTKISKSTYRKLFNSDIEKDFPNEIKSLTYYKLLEEKSDEYILTSKGFFYADTIAGHFAWMRVNELNARYADGLVVHIDQNGRPTNRRYFRNGIWQNNSINHFMG